MLSIAAFIMAKRNEGCWFGNIKPCLAGWPNHDANSAVTMYYSLELAWYAHLLLKPVLKYGQPDGRDMMLHHCASMALLIASCGLNLTRMGVVVLTLFGISNPALHAAKITNQLHLGKLRLPAFTFFALTFCVTRVFLVPPVVLLPALVHSRHWIGYAVDDFHTAYTVLNLLLWVLYGMQLVWMWAVLRVLRQAADKGMDEASKLSAKIDPAKRYAAAPAGVIEKVEVGSNSEANGRATRRLVNNTA
jgi:TLC domain